MSESPRALPYVSPFATPISHRLRWLVEVEEYPTREPELANRLIQMVDECPEVGQALETICAYSLSSGTGDELGFAIVEDPKNPRPDQVAIAQALIERIGDIFKYWQIIWRMMAWGDCFASIQVDTQAREVQGLLLLPTWQVFVIPDEITAQPLRYEQRVSQREAIKIDPLVMVYWAYNKRYLYGRSLFRESLNDWDKLERADTALADGAEQITYQPNLHIMPPGTDETYKQQYKADHEARKKQGIIPDIYLMTGQEVKKPSGLPASYPLNGFVENFNLRRNRIAARSRVPFYLMGIETRYAREIAMQPAIGFKVFVGVVRQLLAAGLREVINMELALKGVSQPWHYRIVFPELNVNPFAPLQPDHDVDEPGIEDVEESASVRVGERVGGNGRVSHER